MEGKDFFGGYSYMSQGPLPQLWANTQMSARGLWGARLMPITESNAANLIPHLVDNSFVKTFLLH